MRQGVDPDGFLPGIIAGLAKRYSDDPSRRAAQQAIVSVLCCKLAEMHNLVAAWSHVSAEMDRNATMLVDEMMGE